MATNPEQTAKIVLYSPMWNVYLPTDIVDPYQVIIDSAQILGPCGILNHQKDQTQKNREEAMLLSPEVSIQIRVVDNYESGAPAFVEIVVEAQAEEQVLERIEVYPLKPNLRQNFASEIQRVIVAARAHYTGLVRWYHTENTQASTQSGHLLDDIERQLTDKCSSIIEF